MGCSYCRQAGHTRPSCVRAMLLGEVATGRHTGILHQLVDILASYHREPDWDDVVQLKLRRYLRSVVERT